ncbi:sensor histidine kinase [Spirillospora sp. CA-255316]
MDDTPPPPLIRRLPPGIWTALAWLAAVAYSSITSVRLPGEVQDLRPSPLFSGMGAGHLYTLAVAALTTLAGSALLGRRPLTALALLLGGSVCMAMALNSTEITFEQFLPAEVALCHIAVTRPRRVSVAAAVLALGTLAGYASVRLLLGYPIGTAIELAVGLTAVIAWLVGNSLRQGREHARTLNAQAVTAERLRIARELHDMVAHSIGIIAIQAGAARMVIDTRPAAAGEALGAIENASRETLAGLRRMLGALRRAEAPSPGLASFLGEPASAAPAPPPAGSAPGLADVERLVAATSAAGVHVDVRWQGGRDPLPPEIDLSAYRIVQEAVTNVVRHAGARRCRVTIERRDAELSIEVVDPGGGLGGHGGHGSGHGSGHGQGTPGGGYGIVGMRERVGLLRGDFTAGPRPEGGFRVAARLPLPAGVR